MNSLEILPLRNNSKIDWEEIKYLSLPSLFKLFNDLYIVKDIFDSNMTRYYDPDAHELRSLGMFISEIKPSMVIDSFFDPVDIQNQIDLLFDKDDELDREILDSKYIPFAFCASGQLLLVSTNSEKQDKIYLFTRWFDEPIEFIADNIFDFFLAYNVDANDNYLNSNKAENLYKNWGEDFWRVRRI